MTEERNSIFQDLFFFCNSSSTAQSLGKFSEVSHRDSVVYIIAKRYLFAIRRLTLRTAVAILTNIRIMLPSLYKYCIDGNNLPT